MLLVLEKNKLTIGTNFAIGETRFRLPLHLLRFTVRSSSRAARGRARARAHTHSEAGCTRYRLLAVVMHPHAGGRPMIRRRVMRYEYVPARRRPLASARCRSRAPRPCGAEEIRTPDLLLAKETLYQLSHGPRGDALFEQDPKRHGQHSGQESGASDREWAVLDSNQRPLPYQGSALTS
jgi:hypothetical protein